MTWARIQQTGQDAVCPALTMTSHLFPLAQPELHALCLVGPAPGLRALRGDRQGRPGVLRGEGKQRRADRKAGVAGL